MSPTEDPHPLAPAPQDPATGAPAGQPAAAASLLATIAQRLQEAGAGRVSRKQLQRELDQLVQPLGMEIDLAWDRDAQTQALYYNAVISQSGVGSFLLSFAGHDDRPWAVRGGQHRADSLLVTVNGEPLTVAQALRSLELLWEDASLSAELVNQALLRAQLKREDRELTEEEIDVYVERFRRSRRLFAGADFAAWLEARGLSREDFRKEATQQARLLALKLARTAGARLYFDGQRSGFDLFVLAEWRLPSAEAAAEALATLNGDPSFWRTAELAASDPSRAGLLPRFHHLHRRDLPAALADGRLEPGATGLMTGPFPAPEGGFSLYRLVGFQEARFDDRTQRRIEKLLYDEWLGQLRASSEIEWNWGLVPDADGQLP